MTCVTSDSRNVNLSQRGFLLDELHLAHKNVTVVEICIITHSFDLDLFENASFNEDLHFYNFYVMFY